MGENQNTKEPQNFFISYTHTNKQWAEWIAWQLEEAGYTTIIQAWDFHPGGNFVLDMHAATTQAERTIVVLSPDYLASQFTPSEWATAFRRDPKGEQGFLIPVRIHPCDVEGLLGQIIYIDLVDQDEQTARSTLLAGVKHERRKPASAPAFPPAPHKLSERPSFPYALPHYASSAGQEKLFATIDTDEIIGIFRQFLKTSSTTHVLYIIGEAKLGKSHLLTKVFPILVQQEYQVRYAVIDLRHPQTIPEILSLTSSQLNGIPCTHYKDAEREWANQPKVRMEHVFLLLSTLTLSGRREHDDLHRNADYLTTQFIKDLEAHDDRPLLLLIDHVDNATEEIQAWLINTFLVRISLLKHIWVVVAGRSVPEPHGRYAASCLRYQLRPVTEEDAYIAYCHHLKVTLVEQSVRDFAFSVDYRPGMFVDLVIPKFQQRR